MNTGAEVAELIATLHHTERRLQELTLGEVDSVMDTSGRMSLLSNAQEQLRHSEAAKQVVILELKSANEGLEAFSYTVSHDLRGPLAHIIGFVEILQRRAGPSLAPEHLAHLTTIHDAAERMGTLIDDLLAFSHSRHVDLCKSEVDCSQLIAEVVSEIEAQTAARNIAWRIHALPSVSVDRALLRMALVNLLSNAVKFTGARAQPRIEIGCVPGAGAETVLFVRDNGAGFDPALADQLFGAFKRLHSQTDFKGTGIGLASVKRIIQRHGGRVWADSTVDGGATFYFSIPRSSDASGA